MATALRVGASNAIGSAFANGKMQTSEGRLCPRASQNIKMIEEMPKAGHSTPAPTRSPPQLLPLPPPLSDRSTRECKGWATNLIDDSPTNQTRGGFFTTPQTKPTRSTYAAPTGPEGEDSGAGGDPEGLGYEEVMRDEELAASLKQRVDEEQQRADGYGYLVMDAEALLDIVLRSTDPVAALEALCKQYLMVFVSAAALTLALADIPDRREVAEALQKVLTLQSFVLYPFYSSSIVASFLPMVKA
ncbi:hypothetical protein KFL_015060010 [Klebsormidium nitens]|uniref:Uncharacterized protein n=1 Tax=Klebsormidium nitens TaxID=105231 RepID=A0A1Y1IUW7_KLENI|nr:hypothetical protein KFL_015060010 [Klebsormidium nitens]|eukprot:GAQ93409.1 hypothetical protein KFL_015060010 [Klebsormidium nitens]